MFTFVLAAAAGHSLGMRPEQSSFSQTANFAKLGLASKTGSSSPIETIKDLKATMDSIMLQVGKPADDHMSDDDHALLVSVRNLVEKTFYGSMDSAHVTDLLAVDSAHKAITTCNSNMALRLNETAPDGENDLFEQQQTVRGKQTVLNGAKTDLDDAQDAETAAQTALDNHIKQIPAAPACPSFPAADDRTKANMDVYFSGSDYLNWYMAQQAAYKTKNTSLADACAAATQANTNHLVALGIRDQAYCDWSSSLTTGCTLFTKCYTDAVLFYNVTLRNQVVTDVVARKEAFIAGQNIIESIDKLLNSTEYSSDEDINEAASLRYDVTFPAVPAQGPCDLEALDSAEFVPVVECESPGKD